MNGHGIQRNSGMRIDDLPVMNSNLVNLLLAVRWA
jgi:hypothetical protein